jgi:hypothetical protein
VAGILDSKQRVMDVMITDEGRAQAASGELTIKYVTFTDRHTFYETDTPLLDDAVANDASGRIYFECSSRHQDQIVVETIDAGVIKPFRSTDFDLSQENLISGLTAEGVASEDITVYSGSNFVENSNSFIDDLTKNFSEQQILGTYDPFSDSTEFTLNNTSLAFTISNNNPVVSDSENVRLENIESIFQDKRFSTLPNFLYLPPENAPRTGERYGRKLGNYVNWNQKPILTFQELLSQLSNKEYYDIEFVETSRENNIVVQPFEFSEFGVKKLCVVDYGEFPDEDPTSPGKRVFFVGKIFKDAFGSSTFVNIFTIIMD